MSVQLVESPLQPFFASENLTERGTVIVRGLFTTDNLDRERDFVDPLEFNLEVFNTTGTLLRNHQFVKDLSGNHLPAGKVLKTVPVIISQENPENSSEWVLKSLVSDDIVALWPKSQSPNLLVGDRAIHVVAEVTHPEVVQQVLNKELRAFSWKGLSIPVERENGVTEITRVDLLEISLVNIPANPDATFIITDENDPTVSMEISLKDCSIYKLGFDKESYPLETIKEYTKTYTNTSIISENSDKYFVQFGEPDLVDTAKSFLIQVGERYLLAAPKIEEKKTTVPIVGNLNTHLISENIMSDDVTKKDTEDKTPLETEKFYIMDIDALKARLPEVVVSLQKSTLIGEQPVEFHFVELPAVAPVESVEEESPEEENADEVVEKTTEAVVTDVLDAKLDKLTTAVESLVATLTPPEEEEVEELPVEKTAEEIKEELRAEFEEKLLAFKAQEEAVQAQRETLQKSLAKIAAFETAVPPKTEREDKVTSSKSTETPSQVSSVDFFANQIMKGVN